MSFYLIVFCFSPASSVLWFMWLCCCNAAIGIDEVQVYNLYHDSAWDIASIMFLHNLCHVLVVLKTHTHSSSDPLPVPRFQGVFIICWLPFFLTHVLKAHCRSCCISPTLYSAVTWLGYLNSAVNPVIYTTFNIEFRKAFIKILHCWEPQRWGASSVKRQKKKPDVGLRDKDKEGKAIDNRWTTDELSDTSFLEN